MLLESESYALYQRMHSSYTPSLSKWDAPIIHEAPITGLKLALQISIANLTHLQRPWIDSQATTRIQCEEDRVNPLSQAIRKVLEQFEETKILTVTNA